MNKQSYQKAFASLCPSEDAVKKLIENKAQTARRPKTALRIAAIVAAALVLCTGVYAAARWLSLHSAEGLTEPPLMPIDGSAPTETRPAPQTVLEFSTQKSDTYIGFLLPETYTAAQDGPSITMLSDLLADRGAEGATLEAEQLSKAYVRYRSVNERESLGIQVLDAAETSYKDYFTRYETVVEKEDRLNGLETLWIRAGINGQESYNLFQRSEEYGCIIVVSSNESFAAAEHAAGDVTLVDSGAAIVNAYDGIRYAVRLTQVPEGWSLWNTAAMDRVLTGSVVLDASLDLSELYDAQTISHPNGCEMNLTVEQNASEASNWLRDLPVLKTGEINGHPAKWLE